MGDESDAEPMSADILTDNIEGSQYHLIINMRDAQYKIRDRIKQRQAERKEALLSAQNRGKGLHKVFKGVVNELSESITIMKESGSEVSHFIPEPRNFAEVTILSS